MKIKMLHVCQDFEILFPEISLELRTSISQSNKISLCSKSKTIAGFLEVSENRILVNPNSFVVVNLQSIPYLSK